MSDADLLQRYVQAESSADFSEIVRRHLDLVYSVACRRTGSTFLAEDVATATLGAGATASAAIITLAQKLLLTPGAAAAVGLAVYHERPLMFTPTPTRSVTSNAVARPTRSASMDSPVAAAIPPASPPSPAAILAESVAFLRQALAEFPAMRMASGRR